MANGKGALSCSYCRHQLEAGKRCSFHEAALPFPKPGYFTICCHFEPNSSYWRDNGARFPPARQFAQFGKDLEAGVLYQYLYNTPSSIEELAVLKRLDYDRRH